MSLSWLASVIIDDSGDVVYVHGRTGKFLEPAEGKSSLNIVEMARPGLRRKLAEAIRSVTEHKQETDYPELRVTDNGGEIFVNLTVKPVFDARTKSGLMMVVFEEFEKAPQGKPTPKRAAARKKVRSAAELEQDLQHTRENLQATIEQLETSNEELKSTNEELQSTNEELQSTNEQLETSKEELQSLNEESATVNAELQARIEELFRANDDMKNLLDSTNIATIFLDTDLRVRRFTPKATEILPLEANDIGRPIKHLASTLKSTDLTELGRSVLHDLTPLRIETTSIEGRSYVLRVRPYRTVANVIDGVVITFEDVSELKHLDELKRLAIVVRDSNDAITLQDSSGAIVAWNRGAERLYGYTEAEARQMNIRDIVPPEKLQEAEKLLRNAFEGQLVTSLETKRLTKDGRSLSVWLTATLIPGEGDEPAYLATTERGLTDLKRIREAE